MGFLCRAQERNVWTLAQIERYSMCRLRLPSSPLAALLGHEFEAGTWIGAGHAHALALPCACLATEVEQMGAGREWEWGWERVREVGVEGGRPDSAAWRNWLSSLLCIDFDFKSSSSSSAAFSISWLIVSHAAFAARVQECQTRGSGKGAARGVYSPSMAH